MNDASAVAVHYGETGMEAQVLAALAEEGIDINTLTWDQLTTFDQFHTRGLPATREQAALAAPSPGDRVLDIGCSVGGPARCLAAEFGCDVTGIDVTPEYIGLAKTLTERCGLADKTEFRLANAMDLPFEEAAFDMAWSQNVSMNIADKEGFYREICRVLRPGGRFVTSDVAAGPGGEANWPLPWAREPSISFVASQDEMRAAMEEAGLRVLDWQDTTAEAVAVFQNPNQQARRGRLGVGLIAGADFGERSRNLAEGMAGGAFSGVLALAEKPS